jgi:competence protein ComEA
VNPKTILTAARAHGNVWRGPLVKGAFVLAGLAILAFAGHGAAAMVRPGEVVDAGDTNAPLTAATTAPPAMAIPETVITGQVPVQSVAAKLSITSDAGPTDRIALNEATEADLEKLPGIGAKKAALVLALRQRMGRFHAVEDLLKVKGMGRKRLAKIRPFVTVDRN